MKKKNKKTTSEYDEVNFKTREGRFIIFASSILIVWIFVSRVSDTNSYYDSYPGKGFYDLMLGIKQESPNTKQIVTETSDTMVLKELPFSFYLRYGLNGEGKFVGNGNDTVVVTKKIEITR
jgi:hypothetical protein